MPVVLEEYQEEYYHVVTRESQSRETVISLPSHCKPLGANIRLLGNGDCGLLASYYNPEKHEWVVEQMSLHEYSPRHPFATLLIRVATVIDPTHQYEVVVSMSSVLDGAAADVLFALQRRSQEYEALCQPRSAPWRDSAAFLAAKRNGALPALEEAVTLATPVPVMGGCVLTGGGFVSHYPVLRDGAALSRSMASVYDDIVAGEEFCGPPLPLCTAPGAGGDHCDDMTEYTAWSVTAAANAGLTCFSIGLRRRRPLEWRMDLTNDLLHPFTAHPTQSSQPNANDTARGQRDVVLPVREDSLPSRYPASVSILPQSEPSLMEMLMLRRMLRVSHARQEGQEWSLHLPPPHRKCSLSFGPCRRLLRCSKSIFYADPKEVIS